MFVFEEVDVDGVVSEAFQVECYAYSAGAGGAEVGVKSVFGDWL